MNQHERMSGPGERAAGPSRDGAVVIEVGGDLGAAVIYTGDDLAGAEIEIRPAAGEWRGVHTAVRQRRLSGDTRYAAVFGSLASGRYDLRIRPGRPEIPPHRLEVIGGEVAEVTWSGTT